MILGALVSGCAWSDELGEVAPPDTGVTFSLADLADLAVRLAGDYEGTADQSNVTANFKPTGATASSASRARTRRC